MNSLIVTAETPRSAEKGMIELGEKTVSRRGKNYRTYEVRLSSTAAKIVENGDVINWWDSSSDLPCIELEGEIIKKNKRYQLKGYRDVGIDSGHPPHLSLKMKTRKEITWILDEGEVFNVVRAPWGSWYKMPCQPPGIWGIKSHEELMAWTSAEQFDGKDRVLSKNKRLKVVTEPEDSRGWISGYLLPQKRAVRNAPTEPLVL